MKEITQPKQVHITEERVIFQTEDGKIFYSKQKAIEHEKDLYAQEVCRKLKCIILDIDKYDYWQYISTDEELEMVHRHYKPHNIYGELKIGEWFHPKWEDETDCSYGSYEIYTLEYIKDQFSKIK